MNWDDHRYALAIMRERSLNGAAQSLGVAHTTVGRRLRGLEAALGVRLFDRTPEGLVPTAAGLELLEVAEQIEGEMLSLEGRLLGRDAKLRGRVRVTTMPLMFRRFSALFAAFIERYPSVELTVLTTDESVSLTRREADVALRMSNHPPEHLVGRKVGRVAFAIYASRALVERVGDGSPCSDYPWLHWDDAPTARWLDGWLAEHAPGARIAMRLSSTSAVLQAVAAGIGVHFLPCFEGEPDARLQRIGPIAHEYSQDLWLLTLHELRHTVRIRAFLDHMQEALRDHPELLPGDVA